MSYMIKLLPEAHLDIKDCIDWYNEQKAGLGKLFYQTVKSRLAYTPSGARLSAAVLVPNCEYKYAIRSLPRPAPKGSLCGRRASASGIQYRHKIKEYSCNTGMGPSGRLSASGRLEPGKLKTTQSNS